MGEGGTCRKYREKLVSHVNEARAMMAGNPYILAVLTEDTTKVWKPTCSVSDLYSDA